MLGAAGAAHAATRLRAPSTSTTHIRHAPVGVARFRWHKVGMSMLLRCAVSRTVSPGLNKNLLPLITMLFSVGIRLIPLLFSGSAGQPGERSRLNARIKIELLQKIKGLVNVHPGLSRLCRNWQNDSYLCFRHSGLDPWFDRLTTLSEVEGESSAFSSCCASGYPRNAVRGRLLKSGMTSTN